METAQLVRRGRSQAVTLPEGYGFEGDTVFIKRVGDAVVLMPKEDTWSVLFDSLDRFSEDFMEHREQPIVGKRDSLFE